MRKLYFRLLFLSKKGLWWKEGSCGVNSIARVAKNEKRASTRKYFIGLGNLCSSAAHN